MMYLISYLIFTIVWQETIPYKPSAEYEVIIDYKFKDRPTVDQYKVDFDKNESKGASGPLPYLKLSVKLLQLGSNETKLKVINSTGNLVYNRKVNTDSVIKLDLGFIDDIKDQVSPNEFTFLFSSDSKAPISQIHMIVMEDGTFLVNDEKKGKF